MPSNLMVDREVAVTTRVSGVIDEIYVDRGDAVRARQPLARLDQREFNLDVAAAEENYHLRDAEYRRYQQLVAQKLSSEAELEQKKAAFEVARVELEKSRLVVDRSVIRAPFDGVIVERFARIGQKVLLDGNDALFRLTALEPLLARAYLPEKFISRVRKGDGVDVRAVQFRDATSRGVVSYISPVVDAGSGAFQVMVKLPPDPARVLRPGMSVELTFQPRSP